MSYRFTVTPKSSSDEDVEAARLAELILEWVDANAIAQRARAYILETGRSPSKELVQHWIRDETRS